MKILVTVIICTQLIWSGQSIYYDLTSPYSASAAAKDALVPIVSEGHKISGSAYYNIAVLPYFNFNIYNNLNRDKDYAFWKWTDTMNHIDLNQTIKTQMSEYLLLENYSSKGFYNHSGAYSLE